MKNNNDKVRIGLLTFHRAYNYGAVLQCYALKRAVNESGALCQVVDYWPTVFKEIYYLKAKRTLLHPHISYTIRKLRIIKALNRRNKGFETFLEQYILSNDKTYTKKQDLNESNLSYSGYIVGSDQVWSPTCADFDSVYFLDFPAADNRKKFSFAASIGAKSIPEELKLDYFERLNKFDYITTREVEGAELVGNLLHRKVETVCDPTLLLDSSQWKELINLDVVPQKKYIFLYYVTEGYSVRKYASALSKQKGLPVISVPCRVDYEGLKAADDIERGFIVYNDISPAQFLGLVANAAYVITNSFHGTVFSAIFHKQFLSQYHLDNGKYNDRVMNLFTLLNLDFRVIDNEHVSIDDSIHWGGVDEKIGCEKQRAFSVIKKMIDICKKEN